MVRTTSRPSVLAAATLAALWIAACGRSGAETALLAGDEAVLRVRPAAERYVPDEFAALVAGAAAARAAYDRGDYQAAQELASAVPGRADQVLRAAEAARDGMATQWDDLRERLPERLRLVADKLDALSGMRRPPTFISPEQVDSTRRRLAEANLSWSDALRAFNEGDVIEAVETAATALSTADELAARLEPVILTPPR